MNVVRSLAALCAAGLIVLSATIRASAQADLDADSDITPYAVSLTPQAEQRALAQLGLGHAFMWRLLHSQINILGQENDGKKNCEPLSDGGSIRLINKTGTFNTKATVEIYYDVCPAPKHVFVHSELTFNQDTPKSVIFSQKADFFDMDGKKAGSLSLKADGAKAAGSVVKFDGTGTWTPPKGAKAQVGLRCDYPEKLANGKSFTCNYAIAQSFRSLKFDFGAAATIAVDVVPVKKSNGHVAAGLFNGKFTGTAKIYSGDLGKLKVSSKIGIAGGKPVDKTAILDGTIRLTVFWPNAATQLNKWTVTHGPQTFTASMLSGPDRNTAGTITNGLTPQAAFNVDKPGAGTITYSPAKTSAITNWLVSE